MKIFTTKLFSLFIVFLTISVIGFSKTATVNSYSKEETKTFSVYFDNKIINHSDEQKIKSAFMEKAHIFDCNIQKRDGFVIFVIKTEREIEKQNIRTILDRLGFSLDKEGKITLRQE